MYIYCIYKAQKKKKIIKYRSRSANDFQIRKLAREKVNSVFSRSYGTPLLLLREAVWSTVLSLGHSLAPVAWAAHLNKKFCPPHPRATESFSSSHVPACEGWVPNPVRVGHHVNRSAILKQLKHTRAEYFTRLRSALWSLFVACV